MDQTNIQFCEMKEENLFQCRVCLKNVDSPKILSLTDKKKFFQITGVELDEFTVDYLCKKCSRQLMISYEFRTRAIKSDELLQKQVPETKIDDFEELPEVKIALFEAAEVHEEPEKEKKVEKLFICDICDERFERFRQISDHIRAHRRDLGRYCRFCDKVFETRSICSAHERNHMLRQSTIRPCVCEHCGKNYTNLRQLKMHSRTHNESYKCTMEGCTDAFTQKRAYYSHFAKKHGIARPCVCDDCGNTFSNHLTLRNHRRLFHDEGVKVFCPECPNKFLNQGQLDNHIAVKHRGERKHSCEICSRSYGRSTHLKRHYHDSHYDHYLELVKTKPRWKI
ncbi:zinc finger protein 600-like [Culicoides brevitarsis]|uniref:zinc finger protein 600-like n=1 Tax=Culicoides brevitarsis TaxID=469753 RepID=UPI00307C0CB1